MGLLKMSEMTEEQIDLFNSFFKAENELGLILREPEEKYDDSGLKFEHEYLSLIGINLILLPIEYMAKYVDAICKHHVDTDRFEFIDHVLISVYFSLKLENLNATSIGNLAYIVLNCKSSISVSKAKYFLNLIHEDYSLLLNSLK